jgi:hypothetical protein
MVAEALERSEDLVDSSDDADRRGATDVAKAKATFAVQLRYVVSSVLVGKALIVVEFREEKSGDPRNRNRHLYSRGTYV